MIAVSTVSISLCNEFHINLKKISLTIGAQSVRLVDDVPELQQWRGNLWYTESITYLRRLSIKSENLYKTFLARADGSCESWPPFARPVARYIVLPFLFVISCENPSLQLIIMRLCYEIPYQITAPFVMRIHRSRRMMHHWCRSLMFSFC